MLEDIKYAFKIAVEDLNWMDHATREKTLTKLYAIRSFVGYPGWIMEKNQLDKYYRKVRIKGRIRRGILQKFFQVNIIDYDYFTSFLNLAHSSIRKKLEALRKEPDKNG